MENPHLDDKVSEGPAAEPIGCPQCCSKRLYKDGLRYNGNGHTIQRWLCRDCGLRFSQSDNTRSNRSQRLSTVDTQSLNRSSAYPSSRQVCDLLTEESKNLATVENPPKNRLAGATEQTIDAKGKIVEHAFWMKKEGYAENTITRRIKLLTTLMKRGANLLDPESVKAAIAQQQKWNLKTKEIGVETYSCFLKMLGGKWEPPKYRPTRTLPFIPTEQELNQLIAGCNKKTATFLQLLKETGARCGEAWMLKWTDFNFENRTVNITPEKGSDPRQLRISDRLIAMLNNLSKEEPETFGFSHRHFARNYRQQRKRIAAKLKNNRINEIHFHTLRHWKATMEYAKTKDILHVMKMLGHKNIQNTLLYTQLINFESDDFHSATAQTVQEAQKLVEAGFEYVCDFADTKLFRKRK